MENVASDAAQLVADLKVLIIRTLRIEDVLPNSRLRAVAESGQAELLDVFSIGGRQVVVSRYGRLRIF